MDTRRIRAFLLAEKYKSFSKVAEEFSYTPSALSHMADALEKEIGVTLFDRTPHGVELTESGKRLYDRFIAVIEAEDALFQAADEIAREQETILRIATYSSIARHLLPVILRDFKEKYPAVKTSIIVEDDIRDCLKNDTADIIFTDEHDRISTAEWCPIMEDRYVAVVPFHLFSGETVVDKEALYTHPFIRIDDALLDEYFTYSHFNEIVRIQSIENETAVSMVKENVGITVLPTLTVSHCPEGVKVLELTPKVIRTLGVQYKKNNTSVTTDRFVKHLQKQYGLTRSLFR